MLLLDKEVRKIAAMVMEEGISLRSAVVIARLEYYFLSRLAEEKTVFEKRWEKGRNHLRLSARLVWIATSGFFKLLRFSTARGRTGRPGQGRLPCK